MRYLLTWGRELDAINRTEVGDLSHLLGSVSLDFLVEWDMDELFAGVVSWMQAESPAQVSQVGVLCSPECAKLLRGSIPAEIVEDFWTMILSLSIVHCLARQAEHADLLQNLEHMGVLAGRRVLVYLDQLQSSGNITGFDNNVQATDIAKANVLILLGTTIGIYYTTDADCSREFHILDSETGSYRPSTLWNAMKEHLCLMLTHHLLFSLHDSVLRSHRISNLRLSAALPSCGIKPQDLFGHSTTADGMEVLNHLPRQE